jgi:hypothetical protein
MDTTKRATRRRASAIVAGAITFALANTNPREAQAFCGFYVAPNDAPLYADATMVALMRDGTRTVLSMSNNYKGPPEDFAMVVPVPVVLQKENVKTLPLDVFQKLERLSAPRLVEYWEQDPCRPPMPLMAPGAVPMTTGAMGGGGAAKDGDFGVKVEAKFTVGEYDIVILSAKESDGLEKWLNANKYKIPAGAASALAPYVKEQQKFFVAKVDVEKVHKDEKGTLVLSPLRVHYESPDFRLPVRLGLINAPAGGKQDLIVWIMAKGKRYETANYTNTFVPTNLDVADETRNSFGSFYATLFDATIAKAGGRAVVTEYSWSSGSCDPCPTPPLEDGDVATLGGDFLFGLGAAKPTGGPATGTPLGGFYGGGGIAGEVVLTRLHARYDQSTLTDDLVFKEADPMVGGREWMMADPKTPGAKPELEKGARKDSYNNFQARYAIRHPWTGPMTCDAPVRGIWGGPPSGTPASPPTAATGLAAAPRKTAKLASLVKSGLDDPPSWDKAAGAPGDVVPKKKEEPTPQATTPKATDTNAPGPILDGKPETRKSCGCELRSGEELGVFGATSLLSVVAMLSRSRTRTRRPMRTAPSPRDPQDPS